MCVWRRGGGVCARARVCVCVCVYASPLLVVVLQIVAQLMAEINEYIDI